MVSRRDGRNEGSIASETRMLALVRPLPPFPTVGRLSTHCGVHFFDVSHTHTHTYAQIRTCTCTSTSEEAPSASTLDLHRHCKRPLSSAACTVERRAALHAALAAAGGGGHGSIAATAEVPSRCTATRRSLCSSAEEEETTATQSGGAGGVSGRLDGGLRECSRRASATAAATSRAPAGVSGKSYGKLASPLSTACRRRDQHSSFSGLCESAANREHATCVSGYLGDRDRASLSLLVREPRNNTELSILSERLRGFQRPDVPSSNVHA